MDPSADQTTKRVLGHDATAHPDLYQFSPGSRQTVFRCRRFEIPRTDAGIRRLAYAVLYNTLLFLCSRLKQTNAGWQGSKSLVTKVYRHFQPLLVSLASIQHETDAGTLRKERAQTTGESSAYRFVAGRRRNSLAL
jgi:hypothetical protein